MISRHQISQSRSTIDYSITVQPRIGKAAYREAFRPERNRAGPGLPGRGVGGQVDGIALDQPNLADEFRELAGVTPAEYPRSPVNGPNHLRAEVTRPG
jgi:hypothetical protein